jgi:hypothetical protein
MSGPVILVRADETSNNEMACSHANSSSKQNRLATELVDVEQSRDCKDKFNYSNNTSRQESKSVTFESEASEDERCTESSCQWLPWIDCNILLTNS